MTLCTVPNGQIALLDARDGNVVRVLADAKNYEGSNIVYSECGGFVIDGFWDGVHLRAVFLHLDHGTLDFS